MTRSSLLHVGHDAVVGGLAIGPDARMIVVLTIAVERNLEGGGAGQTH